MKTKFFLLILVVLFMAGCSQSEYIPNKVVLPSYVKKVSIIGFKDDKGGSNVMTDKLMYAVRNKFVEDSRIGITKKEEADAWLFGTITRYMNDTIAYDQSLVSKRYQLWVWVDISLVDAHTQELMWTEHRLESKLEYGTISSDPFAPSTEAEAQDIASNTIADKIVKRTIDGWFAASGASSKE